MLKTNLIILVLSLFCGSSVTFAGQQVSQEQIRQILTGITSNPRDAWIPAGTISGIHQHYDIEMDEITTTRERVKYDGNRFCWAIDIQSYTDLNKNTKRNVDIESNVSRVFAWNGNEYTLYFKTGKNAIVAEDTLDTPVAVNGPLKAGVVPWGHGVYKLEKLLASLVSAEMNQNGNLKIVIANASEYSIMLELDPAKDHAVISQVIEKPGKSRTSNSYDDYREVSGNWIPFMIAKEKIDLTSGSQEIITYDHWKITAAEISTPGEDQLRINYDDNTRVEFRTYNNKAISYRHKTDRDTDYMLQHRRYNISLGDRDDRNCATAAISYAVSCLGKEMNTRDYEGLVSGTQNETSLYRLNQFTLQKELYSLPVRANLETLSSLQNCQIILHLTDAKHYVVFDHIDDQDIWLIDLDSDKFYYRKSIKQFNSEWKDRTALIISNKPVSTPEGCSVIPESQLHEIKGAITGFGLYSCTDLIQEYYVELCPSMFAGSCGLEYVIWYNRYGCELNAGGGFCGGDIVIGNIYSYCIEDSLNPGTCTVNGNWINRPIRACQ